VIREPFTPTAIGTLSPTMARSSLITSAMHGSSSCAGMMIA
jgi:hypothetical protein